MPAHVALLVHCEEGKRFPRDRQADSGSDTPYRADRSIGRAPCPGFHDQDRSAHMDTASLSREQHCGSVGSQGRHSHLCHKVEELDEPVPVVPELIADARWCIDEDANAVRCDVSGVLRIRNVVCRCVATYVLRRVLLGLRRRRAPPFPSPACQSNQAVTSALAVLIAVRRAASEPVPRLKPPALAQLQRSARQTMLLFSISYMLNGNCV